MSGELEIVLKMVAEGRITAAEAAPIVAALGELAGRDAGKSASGHVSSTAEPRIHDSAHSPRPDGQRIGSGRDSPTERRIRVYVAENGHQVINIQIPFAAAGFAIDQVPGLSPDHRSRIVEAIKTGMTGPILEVSDNGGEVRIVIE
ncbi:MAG TPA: hypothetical protein VF344_01460 [Candidatus Limnocylindrales bacterium]